MTVLVRYWKYASTEAITERLVEEMERTDEDALTDPVCNKVIKTADD